MAVSTEWLVEWGNNIPKLSRNSVQKHTKPKEYTSNRFAFFTSKYRSCHSGASHGTVFRSVKRSSSAPYMHDDSKSVTLATKELPLRETKMLAGLISPCTISTNDQPIGYSFLKGTLNELLRCNVSNANATSVHKRSLVSKDASLPSTLLMKSARLPALAFGNTSTGQTTSFWTSHAMPSS